jgi:pilus assembly protein Flp/PilA
MFKVFVDFLRDEDGVSAIEYGLIAALIAVVIIAAVGGIGDQLKVSFEKIAAKLTTANTSAGGGS